MLGWSLGANRGIEGGGDIGIVVPKVLFLLLVGVILQIVVGFYKSEVFKLFRIVFYNKAGVILIIVNGSSINTKSFYLTGFYNISHIYYLKSLILTNMLNSKRKKSVEL